MRAQGSDYEITKSLLQSVVVPRQVGAEVTTYRGIAPVCFNYGRAVAGATIFGWAGAGVPEG